MNLVENVEAAFDSSLRRMATLGDQWLQPQVAGATVWPPQVGSPHSRP